MNSSVTETTANQLESLVDSTVSWLSQLDLEQVENKPAPDRWSIKEVIGHLIDSAANNHHRFVRAQQQEEMLEFADYEQNFWAARQDYHGREWPELVELWRLYNRHLAHVMRQIDPAKLNVVCRITPHPDCTLEFLVTDYVVHMKHHLDIVRKRVETESA